MTPEQQTPVTPRLPITVIKTLKVLDLLAKLNLSPKQFMVTFMSSNQTDIQYRRRIMKVGKGFEDTRSIIANFGKHTRTSPEGRAAWEDMIFKEASAIVNEQNLPRGHFPNGAYVSSNRITLDFFSESAEKLRDEQVKTGMSFLYSLIHRKLQVELNQPDQDDLNNSGDLENTSLSQTSTTSTSTMPDLLSTALPVGSVFTDELDEAGALSMENLVFVKASRQDQSAHKLAKVPIMVCAMIGLTCNRRSNALPMANGLMGYAGGISCRINEWLHCHGMSTSRNSTLQTMDTLRHLQEDRLMDVFKRNHKLLPLLIYDNIDIQLKIHNTRVESSSRLFHGTWGFYIVVRACLQAKCSSEAASLATFLDAMAVADRKTVQMLSFCPTPMEADHWVSVVKAQLATALKEYIIHLPGAPELDKLPALNTKPPPVDPIEMHEPNIHFLRMMDAPDSSAEGVSRVIDEVIAQIGLDKIKYAESLLVAGGDVGSNQLLESLRTKRFPPIDSVEGMEWVLSIFGGAHTTWNFTKALLTHHWGKSDNGDDSGAWRSLFALGGEYKKPVASQDFNTVMRSARMLHKANLVHIIRETFESLNDVDLTDESECQRLFDCVWERYFEGSVLEDARQSSDPTRYNLMLRLRDFASVVEAHEATRAGDIGRLMLVWKQWAVMSQGVQGLSHYGRHIPRIVLLLEEDLPPDLAHAIKHSLLIPSNGRPDHWLPIDEFLEVSIFYLKRVYNNTGHGTDIRRLTDRVSTLIPVLRKLLQVFKIHSGHTLLFQPNPNAITAPSMSSFLAYAKEHLGQKTARRPSPAVENIYKVGQRQMIKLIRADQAAGRKSRFRWGAADVLSSWDSQSMEFPGEADELLNVDMS